MESITKKLNNALDWAKKQIPHFVNKPRIIQIYFSLLPLRQDYEGQKLAEKIYHYVIVLFSVRHASIADCTRKIFFFFRWWV